MLQKPRAAAGSLSEEDALLGRFRMPADERVQETNQEKLLLIATVEELLRHELALKEIETTDTYLVFPSQITWEYPHSDNIAGKSVVYTFEGALLNVYVSLVVRLSQSSHFENRIAGEMLPRTLLLREKPAVWRYEPLKKDREN